MTRRSDRWFSGAAVAVLLMATSSRPIAQTMSGSRPMSATVVATNVRYEGQLALLVLWRGSPGWTAKAGYGHSGGGGGSNQRGSVSFSYGDQSFAIEFDYQARTARLFQKDRVLGDVSLAQTNVVLVDDVDGPSGARVATTQWTDPVIPAGLDASVEVVRRSPALIEYLQCGTPWPLLPIPSDGRPSGPATDPAIMQTLMQQMITLLCSQVLGP